MKHEIFNKISRQQGWKIQNIYTVHGGDINRAYCIETSKGKFFVKMNNAKKFPKMLEKEAAGLTVLHKHFSLKVPEVIAVGEANDQQYLVLEWLQVATANTQSWQALGRSLAQLHKITHTFWLAGGNLYSIYCAEK